MSLPPRSTSRSKEVKYETKVVTVGTIQKTTIVTGKIEPRDEVEIKPQISGIITELYKQAGDKVRVGDAIAKIKVIPDMAQLNSAESRVRLAKYNLENARQVFAGDLPVKALTGSPPLIFWMTR